MNFSNFSFSLSVMSFLLINSGIGVALKCRRCSTTDYDSECRKGTLQVSFECPPDEDACYEEVLIRNSEVPLYRRGCAPNDWCTQQRSTHSDDLKFCKTCQSEHCNTDIFGGENEDEIVCYDCETTNSQDECRTGLIPSKNYKKCPGKTPFCYQSYVSTSRRNTWTRGCGEANICDNLKSKYRNSLISCDKCGNDFCNNDKMKFVYSK